MIKVNTFKKRSEEIYANRPKNQGGFLGGAQYLGASLLAGIGGIGEGITDALGALAYDITGQHDKAEGLFKNNVVGDWYRSQVEEFNPDGVMNFLGDVTHGVGQSAYLFIPYAGAPLFYTGIVSQGISSAAEKTGDVGLKEVAYGGTVGALEGIIDKALGGTASGISKAVKGIGKNAGKNTGKTLFKATTDASRKGLMRKVFSSAASEFAEEFASEYADTFVQRAYLIDPDKQYSFKDAVYSGFVGFTSGAVTTSLVEIPRSVNYNAKGRSIIDRGNSQTLVNTATVVADKLANKGTDFKNAAGWVTALRGQVDAYNKLVQKGQGDSASAATILGEMQAYLAYAETKAAHAGLTERIKNASESDKEALAEYINMIVDKKNRTKDYTAQDITNNTDKIASQLAIMQFAGMALNYDAISEDVTREQEINKSIEDERKAQPAEPAADMNADTAAAMTADTAFDAAVNRAEETPAQTVPSEPSVADEVLRQDATDIESSAAPINDNIEGIKGKIKAAVDKIAVGGALQELSENNLNEIAQAAQNNIRQGMNETDALSRAVAQHLTEVNELSSGYKMRRRFGNSYLANVKGAIINEIRRNAQSEAEKAAETTKISENTETRKSEETATDEKNAPKAETKTEAPKQQNKKAEEKSSERKNESSESRTKAPKVSEAKESLTDEQRAERARKRAEMMLEWEKNNTPTVKEMNTAREYVKGFDNLSPERRQAIIRMIRTAKGVDVKTVKGIANLLAIKAGADLDLRFDPEVSEYGVTVKSGGKTLIVISTKADFKTTVKGTVAHELVHYLENKPGYKTFAEHVMKRVKPEKKKEVEKEVTELYSERYEQIYREEYSKQGLKGAELDKAVTDALNSAEHKAIIDSEVVARIVGEALNSDKFLSRYARIGNTDGFIKKAWTFLSSMVKELKNKSDENNDLVDVIMPTIKSMDRLLQMNNANGLTAYWKKYIFAGENAKTADKLKLATAQKMLSDGVDSETVRKETGWFKGYDGKWRFEIDDSSMKYSRHGFNPDYLRYNELELKFLEGTISDLELQELRNTPKDIKHINLHRLDQFVQHEELFKAYPELKSINVKFDLDVKGNGMFTPEKLTITLNPKTKDIKSTIIHELQHAVQSIEEFSRGSSPEYWRRKGITESEYNSFVEKTEMELNKEIRKLSESDAKIVRKYFRLMERSGILLERINFSNDEETQKAFKEAEKIDAETDKLYEYLYYQPWFSRINELHNQIEISDDLNTVFYKNTAGEIEARNAAERINLTPEERKNTRPDVDREDVVLADGSEASKDFAGWTVDNNEVYITSKKTMNMSTSDRIAKFFNEFTASFKGRTAKFERNGHVHYARFGESKSDIGKFAYEGNDSSSKSSETGYKAKIRLLADGNMFEIVEDANYFDTEAERGKKKKTHKNAKYWDYYIKTIIVDGKGYDVLINVRNDVLQSDYSTKEEYVYSIRFRDNKNVTTSLVRHATSKATSKLDAATNNSIHQNEPVVNSSVKKTDEKHSLTVKESQTSGKETAPKIQKQYSIAPKAKNINEKIARERAENAKVENAQVFAKNDVELAVKSIESWTQEEVLSLATGQEKLELQHMNKAKREGMISDIYIALHEEGAKGRVGPGHIAVKALAAKIAGDYIDSAQIVGENNKSVHLKDIYDESSINQFKKDLTDLLYGEFANMGRATRNAEFQAIIRQQKAAFEKEQLSATQVGKEARNLAYQGNKLRDLVEKQKRDATAEDIVKVTKEMANVVDAKGNIRINAVDQAMKEASRFFEGESLKLSSEKNSLDSADKKTTSTLSDFAWESNDEIKFKIDEYLRLREGREGKALTAEEMRLAGEVLHAMKITIERYNKEFVNGHWINAEEAAKISIADLTAAWRDKEYKNGVTKWLDEKVVKGIQENYFYKILTPETVVETVEGFAKNGLLKSLYHSIRVHKQKAEHLAVQIKKPLIEFIDNKENAWTDDNGHKHSFRNKLNKKMISVNGANGVVDLTLGEAIYLLMLTKREAAHAGLLEKGYIAYNDKNQQRATLRLTDIDKTRDNIYNALDNVDLEYLKMAEDFFNKTSSKIKYDADMNIFGYTNIGDGYYVPMIRDRYSRMNGVTDARQSIESIITVYNKSFNQNLVDNAKGLEGKNIMSIISDHADGLADYAELYLPLKAFDRIYNRAVVTDDGITSIRSVLNNTVWSGTEQYFKDLFADIQGQRERRDNVVDNLVGKIRSGWVNSVLGANVKVIATQTTSLAAATQVINAKYITQSAYLASPGNIPGLAEIRERAYKYSDIIEARNFDMGALKAQGNVDKVNALGEKTGWGIGWMDERICLAIFHASELQIQAQYGHAVGTEENAKLAAKLADEAIYTTQAMSSASERSALQRSTSEIAKMLSMFTSDTVKNLSHLYGNIMKWNAYRLRAKAGDTTYAAEMKDCAKDIAKSARTLAVTGIMLGLITQAFKYLFGRAEEEPEERQEDFYADIAGSTLNILPIASDIMDKLVFDYDMSVNVIDVANDTLESVGSAFKLVGKSASGEYVSTNDAIKASVNVLKSGLNFFGLPVSPVERTVTGLLRIPSPEASYWYKSVFESPAYTTDLKKAVESGDADLAEYVLERLYKDEMAGTYTTPELEEIVRLYTLTDEDGEHYNVLPKKTLRKMDDGTELKAAQRKQFNSIYSQASAKVNELIRSAEYQTLNDEQKAKAIKRIYDLYYNRAAAEVAGKEWSNAQAYSQLTSNYSALFSAQAYKSGLEEYKDERGNVVTVKDQFEEYLKSLNLSETDYLVVAYANGYKSKKNKKALIEYINSLGLSEDVKKRIAEILDFSYENGKVIEKKDE